jgi:hypothetical protein
MIYAYTTTDAPNKVYQLEETLFRILPLPFYANFKHIILQIHLKILLTFCVDPWLFVYSLAMVYVVEN